MPGKLYLVGTPLGNLGDMSPRAVRVLSDVDFIAAEDSEVSGRLLGHFGIDKPVISRYGHGGEERCRKILSRLLAGESCAAITDAGMPCVSDPGEYLVNLCGEHGIEVVAVPGPSALIAALALSGLATGRFSFEGFLSVNRGSRFDHLKDLKDDNHTLIFYEAPKKLPNTLSDMLAVFGDRKIALARELTKPHEEVIRTTLSKALALCMDTPPRGEYVLVVEGAARSGS